MKYDFDKVINRRGTGSEKWNVPETELPMWVADMDFPTAPEIIEALKNRADHGIFGYAMVTDDWYDAVAGWWESRHGFRPEKESLLFVDGVIPAIDTAIRGLTQPGDQVLILTPTYNHFFVSIEGNDRVALECHLLYEEGQYAIDKEDFEKKAAEEKTKIFLMSNPQNPTGNIWDRETLAWLGETCRRHNVLVISDEIHCDLTDPGYDYTPFPSVSPDCAKNSITCIAPTKAFNIAGIQSAAVIVANEELRRMMKKDFMRYDASMPNAFAVDAAVAAFTKGGPWLDGLRSYIAENKAFVSSYLAEHLPQVRAVTSHATYLVWLDFSDVTEDGTSLIRWIRKKTGLYMMKGEEYGSNGKAFGRLNIACPRETLTDGLERLVEGVKTYEP